MSYGIKSIETRYSGCLFRSRLEARWAAMFDLLGWKWTYEPFDLNGWVPDFLLSPLTSEGSEVLVEVKGPRSEWEAAKEKIVSAGGEIESLIVGCEGITDCYIGDIGEMYISLGEPQERGAKDSRQIWWQKAVFGKDTHGFFDFAPEEGVFVQRLTGLYPGGSHPFLSDAESREVKRFWGVAHERTRFTVR